LDRCGVIKDLNDSGAHNFFLSEKCSRQAASSYAHLVIFMRNGNLPKSLAYSYSMFKIIAKLTEKGNEYGLCHQIEI